MGARLGFWVWAALALGLIGCGPAQAQGRFDAALTAEGAGLAKLGDCAVCHTAPGGRAYAGGGKVPTPFGIVYGTNITPDLESGIGRWSLADFDEALRHGRRKGGAPLYPAMPYDHYAGLSDADVRALYAFIMTRPPVKASPPANRLIPPLGFRPLLYVWNALFFRPRPGPAERGAYLVQTLGHCGACHTPHGLLGQERGARALGGGWAEGWYAPALNRDTPAASAWTQERLYAYLRSGLDVDHAAAAGPMGAVTRELARAPDADVRAMAAYLARAMQPAGKAATPPTIDRARPAATANPRGAELFEGACATCHGTGAPMRIAGRPGLERGSPLWEDDPRDTLKIMLDGLDPPTGPAGPFMPPFAASLGDGDLAQLAAYMRARFTDKAPWPGLERQARKARAAK